MKILPIVVQFVAALCLDHVEIVAATRTTADRIRSFGYSSETHNIVTHDGYGLTIFRIKAGNYSDSKRLRPAVLMMHGLTGSSDCWVLNGPKDALAFNLIDSGYDVWLGNARGTPYGSRHVSLSPSSREFWRFSWDVIAVIDLPATIDYILKETGQSSLHYVGHSQGSTIMFALLSTRPAYNRKLATSHMLAPVAYMKYARTDVVRILAPLVGTYNKLDPLLGDMAFLQQPLLQRLFGITKCRQNPLAYRGLCSFWLTSTGGYSAYISETLWQELFRTHPASCSSHQAFHYTQLKVSGHFRPYDFGVQGNLRRYNRTSPPDYDVSNINPRYPIDFYYSDYDVWSSKPDVEHFCRILGNRSVNHFVGLKYFSHYDFLWASNVKVVVNREILHRMNKVEHLRQKS